MSYSHEKELQHSRNMRTFRYAVLGRIDEARKKHIGEKLEHISDSFLTGLERELHVNAQEAELVISTLGFHRDHHNHLIVLKSAPLPSEQHIRPHRGA